MKTEKFKCDIDGSIIDCKEETCKFCGGDLDCLSKETKI